MSEPTNEERCDRCRAGTFRPGTKTITLERNDITLVVKNVPGRICWACGEGRLTEDTVDRLEEMMRDAEREDIETAVRHFTPAPAPAA